MVKGRAGYIFRGRVSSCFLFPDRVPIYGRPEKAGQLQEASKAPGFPTADSTVNPPRVAGMATGPVGSPRQGVHQVLG